MTTDNVNNINSTELEDMCKQMADLKAQLDEQLTLNDKQMRKIMTEKTKKINNFGTNMLVFGIGTSVICFLILHASGFSSIFCIATLSMMIADAFNDYYCAHKFKANMLTDNSIHKNTEIFLGMKKHNRCSFIIGLCIIFFWFIWFFVEIYNLDFPFGNLFNISPEELKTFRSAVLNGGFIGAVIGGAIGIVVGIHLYRKQQKNISEIIDAIGEKE